MSKFSVFDLSDNEMTMTHIHYKNNFRIMDFRLGIVKNGELDGELNVSFKLGDAVIYSTSLPSADLNLLPDICHGMVKFPIQNNGFFVRHFPSRVENKLTMEIAWNGTGNIMLKKDIQKFGSYKNDFSNMDESQIMNELNYQLEIFTLEE